MDAIHTISSSESSATDKEVKAMRPGNRPPFLARLAGTLVSVVLVLGVPEIGEASFVNWENPHVSPLDMTPDGARLLAVNTPDNRLGVFDLSSGRPVLVAEIPVGLDPVSVRARSKREAWVVNHISDSVSIVDLTTMSVVATLQTDNEPADVVFAGSPERAFVSCAQAASVMVFDPESLGEPLDRIAIEGQDPRAMTVSPAGDRVYVAIFESGNASTVLAGSHNVLGIVLDDADGPYRGAVPVPNSGIGFDPPQNPLNPPPPETSLIIKKSEDGRWLDDNIGDWTEWVSGAKSLRSERTPGWDMPDRDLVAIDVATLKVAYARRLMNLNMAVGVNPASGEISVVGTDGINEVRFEPNLNGIFVRVKMARIDAGTGSSEVLDLNPHLDYSASTLPQSERDKSLGDPRGVVWNSSGTRAYITGMGSNNVAVVDENGDRVGPTIEVGEGPTGITIDETRGRLYVLNKFDASLSVIDLVSQTEIYREAYFDPTPDPIQVGRRHLYDTHETSGLGQVACASCHVDSRMDRLAWDLGNPAGEMKSSQGANLGTWNVLTNFGFEEGWHPMKGPMLTQTLQDIIGKEPHHWRGDKDGLEEFNSAFDNLQGDDEQLTEAEMQEFEDFLTTIHFPPNPYRRLDNTLRDHLPLPNFFAAGRQAPWGSPLPDGNPQRGLEMFTLPNFTDSPFACSTCHTLPTGLGTNKTLIDGELVDIPPGPNGEAHLGFVSTDGDVQLNLKVPHLRNLYERLGFDMTQEENTAGFGFHHDGSFDSLSKFFRLGFVGIQDGQDLADVIAFMLSFSGSDLPEPQGGQFEPVGPDSQDTHAAVGKQLTLLDGANVPAEQREILKKFAQLAQTGEIDLVAKGLHQGEMRGYRYEGGGIFQADRQGETLRATELAGRAGPGTELTFTVVPAGSGTRIGVDRDEDGVLDGDE